MRDLFDELSPKSMRRIGEVVWFIGFVLYVIGPTIIDPYGDGLWYGVTSMVGGLLIGYGFGVPDDSS